ncbi:DUF1435 domain-containing protein [Enterobacteriaceae bacterium H11S18]|uniref:DUF1435 domain-containing protein n=1 Tax=Dryocola clanedunensis TaxID=2925396 RepID=UPI0022EFDAB4|nr:DUF1435 domain-containing protein [Dryocola clanedunensis]MCT4705342.1 DUF1435 domain-containing protein [Dryocola clanedunensis]MCT4709714.1 DUF1435 domain-containing protein [Dryocola clanedunensis]
MLHRQLESAWGVIVPGLIVAALVWMDLSFSQWRVLVVLGLVASAGMLYHKRLRHYVLLPSGIAFASGIALVMMNIWR